MNSEWLVSLCPREGKLIIPHSAFRIPHSAFRIPHFDFNFSEMESL